MTLISLENNNSNKIYLYITAKVGVTMTNIIDGMDAARFRSPNNDNKVREKEKKEADKKMPLVLRNLKNGS